MADGTTVVIEWGLGVALVLLIAVAALVGCVGHLGVGWGAITAAFRATLQLAVVSAVILTVIRSPWSTTVFVMMMFTVASVTSARRITAHPSGLAAGVSIGAGVVPVLIIVLGSESSPWPGSQSSPWPASSSAGR